MQKMGHVAGRGLGRRGQGITDPVSATGQTGASRGGVGSAAQKEAAIELSGEQQRAVDLVVNEGRNLFLTGCAGTGKSLVMRRITKQLKAKYSKRGEFVVCATTGVAAVAAGGGTLHGFAGVGIPKKMGDFRKVRKNLIAGVVFESL